MLDSEQEERLHRREAARDVEAANRKAWVGKVNAVLEGTKSRRDRDRRRQAKFLRESEELHRTAEQDKRSKQRGLCQAWDMQCTERAVTRERETLERTRDLMGSTPFGCNASSNYD